MIKKLIVLGLLVFIPILLNSEPAPVIGPHSPLPDGSGGVPLYNWSPTDDYVGEVYQAGTSWYDYQHNGSTSRVVALDEQSNIHLVWMKGMQSGAADRHVFYNFYDGAMINPAGVQISSYRSGYTTLDLDGNDIPFGFFHSTVDSTRSVCSWDAVYGTGAFLSTILPAPVPDRGLTWPHGCIDARGYIHAAMQTNTNTQIYYSRSTNGGATFGTPQAIPATDGMAAVSQTMAAGPYEKVALGYTNPLTTSWIDEDVFYFETEDGVTWNWANPVNITEFGTGSHPMSNEVRAWSFVGMIYDDSYSEVLHIAYTTINNSATLDGASILWHWSELTGHSKITGELEFDNTFAHNDPGAWHSCWDMPTLAYDASGILYCCWEQCTTPGDSSMGGYGNFDVYVAFSEDQGLTWGPPVNITNTSTPMAVAGQCQSEAWPTMAEKADDYLHILYIEDKDAGGIPHTEGQWTENPVIYQKVPIADIQPGLSVSIEPVGGPIVIPAGGGTFDYSIEIINDSDNQVVFDAYIEAILPGGTDFLILLRPHITFAGGTMISRTMSQSVPAGAPSGTYEYRLATGDYSWYEWASDSFEFEKTADDGGNSEVTEWRCSGWGEDEIILEPEQNLVDSHILLQVSPNPFNPETVLSYTLPEAGEIQLSVFDVTGREAAVLHSGYHQAGNFSMKFNAGDLSSGVYFICLKSALDLKTVKILLLK